MFEDDDCVAAGVEETLLVVMLVIMRWMIDAKTCLDDMFGANGCFLTMNEEMNDVRMGVVGRKLGVWMYVVCMMRWCNDVICL